MNDVKTYSRHIIFNGTFTKNVAFRATLSLSDMKNTETFEPMNQRPI